MKLENYKSKYRICFKALTEMVEDCKSMDELMSMMDFTMQMAKEMKENMKAEI